MIQQNNTLYIIYYNYRSQKFHIYDKPDTEDKKAETDAQAEQAKPNNVGEPEVEN